MDRSGQSNSLTGRQVAVQDRPFSLGCELAFDGSYAFLFRTDSQGNPTWNPNIASKPPLLYVDRLVYQNITQADGPDGGGPLTVISQGSIVYTPPLDRYIHSSWTKWTWEFYEAPRAVGPWNLCYRQGFGGYLWHGKGSDCAGSKNGGYATTIPSKFISSDGISM